MIVTDLLGWWYSRGWSWIINYAFIKRSQDIAAFFSIGDLFKTLFAPFRQDSISVRNAPINIRLQAFGENLISRFFGFIIRSALIVSGLVLLFFNICLTMIVSFIWPLLPAAPVVALMLVALGVGA